MVLNDVLKDVEFIHQKLLAVATYISKCQSIYNYYYESQTSAAATFFSTSNTEMSRNSYTSKISSILSKCFNSATELNSFAFNFYSVLDELSKNEYCMDTLNNDVDQFVFTSKQVINDTNSIIMAQLEKSKSQNLIPKFILSIQNLLRAHRKLADQCYILRKLNPFLWEPIPETETRTDLVDFELRSYNSNSNLCEWAQDLQLLNRFMTQLSTFEPFSAPIYPRKVESGSLNVTWSGGKIEINSISDIINALINGIRNLAFLPSDIKLKKQEVEKTRLENEGIAIENTSKKLAVVNSQIDIIADRLNLDKSNPEDKEKIERLCIPLIEYLENNPLGNINGAEYNLKDGMKYLTYKE